MEKDYYSILGINETASLDEIKAAYRKLAKKYHPDVNPNDETSEDKFIEISEAYQILSDDNSRRKYDMERNLGDSLFRGFGNIFSRHAVRPGMDVQISLTVTLEEAWKGCKKRIKLNHKVRCPHCNGTMSADGSNHYCPECNGTGIHVYSKNLDYGFYKYSVPCMKCGGTGKIIEEKCPHCENGLIIEPRELTIDINPQTLNGTGFVIKGEGHESPDTGKPGDLVVIVRVNPEWKGIHFKGKDYYEYDLVVDVVDAVLGCEKTIPWFEGDITVSILPGVQPNQRIETGIEGYTCIVNIVIPGNLSEDEQKTWEELRKLSDKES